VAYAESLFAQYQYGWSSIVSVTDGRFRYIVGPSPALLESSFQASSADARTDANLVRSRADETAALAHALKAFEDAAQVLPPLEPKPPAAEERDQLLALGALGPRAVSERSDVDATIDPASRARLVEAYKAASAAVAARKWSAAIDQLRALAREHVGMLDLWASLASVAMRAERHDIAADAYRRILSVDADAVDARLGLSMALLRSRRLDDARAQAELAAGDAAAEPSARAHARELLARIAVAAHDPGGARVQAQHVLEIDPTSPFPSFIEGRLLFERARYDDALPLLDEAAAGQTHEAILDLHFLRGETLLKLDRAAAAEDAYLAEIESFPENTRAYAALATLYHGQKRDDEATAILTRLTNVVGTPEAFDVSARLWTSFGERDRAAAATRAAAQQRSATPHTVPTQQ
jgi:tetratricopeptide (TPR) repeat protein